MVSSGRDSPKCAPKTASTRRRCSLVVTSFPRCHFLIDAQHVVDGVPRRDESGGFEGRTQQIGLGTGGVVTGAELEVELYFAIAVTAEEGGRVVRARVKVSTSAPRDTAGSRAQPPLPPLATRNAQSPVRPRHPAQ